jgi:hypothetical protein
MLQTQEQTSSNNNETQGQERVDNPLESAHTIIHSISFPLQDNGSATQLDKLLIHQQRLQEKTSTALLISANILSLGNQLVEENTKLSRVERDVAANSLIIDYLCGNMSRISSEIEVYYFQLIGKGGIEPQSIEPRKGVRSSCSSRPIYSSKQSASSD